MEEKKLQIRLDYQEFAQDLYGKEFGQIKPIEQGFALTKYYVAAIHNRTSSFISEEDMDYACIDGPNDLGADMIFRDDGVVYIYQGKYKTAKNGASQEEVENFQSIFERLISPKFPKNRRLTEKLSEIQWDTDSFVLKFICLGKIEATAKTQTYSSVRIPTSLSGLEDRIQIEYLDESLLNDELRSAVSQTSGIPGDLTIFTVGNRRGRTPVIEVPSEDYPSYVLVASVSQIVDMYKRARDRLFTFNIRNYIGNTSTNKSIIETARNSPSHFFHFNNGISCLAKSVTWFPDEGKALTNGLQVINGAQTVKALARAAVGHTLNPDASILVRITQIGKGYSSEGRFANDVTKFNNTQNVIKVSDFRSNDPVQIDLAEKFSALRKNGKKVNYLPKRTDQRKSQSISIKFEEFSKVCYSFLRDPVKFSATTSFLFDVSENGGYRHIFGDGNTVWTRMPTDEFKVRSSVWWMSVAFAEKLKLEKKSTSDPLVIAALERKWFLIYATRVILEEVFGEEKYRAFLIKNWEGDWQLGKDKAGTQFERLYEAAKGAVLAVYKMSERQPSFSHRNWMRNLTTVDSIKDHIKLIPMFKDTLKNV